MKKALITGITGQDGSYLCELLLEKGYTVHGVIRRSSSFNTQRLDHIYQDPHERQARLFLHYGDLTEGSTFRRILEHADPDEIYNLGAQSHVRVSFDQPEYTLDSGPAGTVRLLEAIRDRVEKTGKLIKFYQASSSEMFGCSPPPQHEGTPFYPRSPYGVGKVASYWYTVNYREAYNLYACNGILFNHESPRRGETFVTRKITRALGRIAVGLQDTLFLGNLEARRDWGFAGDYVEAMWMMLQHDTPEDFVIATGRAYSVAEFLDESAKCLGLDWQKYVRLDPRYLRPAEVDHLCGDASKAKTILGWTPRVSFQELVRMMVEADLAIAKKEHLLASHGHLIYNNSEAVTVGRPVLGPEQTTH